MSAMAKIVLSDDAPKDAKKFSLANAEVEIDGAYETNDPQILGDAAVHPWLEVEYDPVAVNASGSPQPLAPEDDVLSRVNSEALKAAETKPAPVVEKPAAAPKAPTAKTSKENS